jgi:hypothetical protein
MEMSIGSAKIIDDFVDGYRRSNAAVAEIR